MTAATTDCSGPAGGVKSVLAALDVLDCFSQQEELGVTEIARRLGVAKSTAHRLLTTLCARGIAEQNPQTGHYRLGLHLFELGQLARERAPLHRAALPLLEEIRRATGQTVHLSVADGADVLFLQRLPSVRAIPLLVPGTRRMPVHVTSAGKVLAAYDPAVARARARAGYDPHTTRSIRTAVDFEKALAQVRRTGYAVCDGEAVLGLASVAVPVRDRAGRARAALSVAGPSREIGAGLGRYVEVLGAAASRLSRTLIT
jgi:DNA-binding IclR family transcriptional regulator